MVRRLSRLKWLVEATFMLALARLLVRFVPLKKWRSTVEQGTASAQANHLELSPRQASLVRTTRYWIGRARREAPFDAVCLPQALAGHWMLKRRDVPSYIQFGAKRDQNSGSLSLHAWLMCGGEYVTGKEEDWNYQTFQRKSEGVGS